MNMRLRADFSRILTTFPLPDPLKPPYVTTVLPTAGPMNELLPRHPTAPFEVRVVALQGYLAHKTSPTP